MGGTSSSHPPQEFSLFDVWLLCSQHLLGPWFSASLISSLSCQCLRRNDASQSQMVILIFRTFWEPPVWSLPLGLFHSLVPHSRIHHFSVRMVEGWKFDPSRLITALFLIKWEKSLSSCTDTTWKTHLPGKYPSFLVSPPPPPSPGVSTQSICSNEFSPLATNTTQKRSELAAKVHRDTFLTQTSFPRFTEMIRQRNNLHPLHKLTVLKKVFQMKTDSSVDLSKSFSASEW